MTGKNFVVIGGSKGIGLQIVLQLIKQHAHVTVVARQTDELPEDDLIHFIQKDILHDDLAADSLPDVIDGLCYCPGSIQLKPFKSLSEAQFTEDFNIHVLGAVKSVKAAFSGLKKSEYTPAILLFSTVAVAQGMPFHASVAASKGAVEGLTLSLAAEFAPNIRANCIAPSLTDTELAARILSTPEKRSAAENRHPLKRVGQAKDIASMATFLLSDAASWITGQVIHVDGGLSTIRV